MWPKDLSSHGSQNKARVSTKDEEDEAPDEEDTEEEEPFLRISFYPVISGKFFTDNPRYAMVTEYRDVVIDGTKQHFFKACKTSPMLNKMCGFKKQVHSGWPLTSTTLLKQLVELRNTAVAMYKTSMHRRAGIPDVVQIESPTVGTATSTNLTVLSGGGKMLGGGFFEHE